LRGRTKEQILDDLRRLRSTKAGEQESKAVEEHKSSQAIQNPNSKTPKPQTPVDITEFWQYYEPLDSSLVVIAPPPDNRTVLDVLGTIPLASADTRVMQYLDEVYKTVSQQAVMSALNRDDA
jgi:uncharacterized Zn finger protein